VLPVHEALRYVAAGILPAVEGGHPAARNARSSVQAGLSSGPRRAGSHGSTAGRMSAATTNGAHGVTHLTR
jgi:hypothetical protein